MTARWRVSRAALAVARYAAGAVVVVAWHVVLGPKDRDEASAFIDDLLQTLGA